MARSANRSTSAAESMKRCAAPARRTKRTRRGSQTSSTVVTGIRNTSQPVDRREPLDDHHLAVGGGDEVAEAPARRVERTTELVAQARDLRGRRRRVAELAGEVAGGAGGVARRSPSAATAPDDEPGDGPEQGPDEHGDVAGELSRQLAAPLRVDPHPATSGWQDKAMRRRAGLLVLALVTAGCSGSPTPSPPPDTDDARQVATQLADALEKKDLTRSRSPGATGAQTNALFQPLVRGMGDVDPVVDVTAVTATKRR